MIYFTSDTHFWHYNIIEFCDRPVAGRKAMSREEACTAMNDLLIRRWNEKITDNDQVYFLGDFAFCGTTKALEILKQLRGTKFWIRGNHDYGLCKKPEVAQHFMWIRDCYTLRVHDSYQVDGTDEEQQYHQPIVLCHFPILSWDGLAHGAWHLHGHCHGSIDNTWNRAGLRMDVGVDTNNLFPYSYTDVKNKMALRTVAPVDYHGTNKQV